jgi:zinc transport system permease protein
MWCRRLFPVAITRATNMTDFLLRAALAGVGVALIAGPLGCFIVWRRMAYFGDALAHSALLGVSLGYLLGLDATLGVVALALAFAALLATGGGPKRVRYLSDDTMLGIVAHGALAAGLVCAAFVEQVRLNLLGYLFGDILATSTTDLLWVGGGVTLALLALAWLWRPLVALTVHAELARVEGVATGPARLGFMVLLALTVAVAMKVVGVILVTALLIVPAATARRFATSPEGMAVGAALLGALAVLTGLGASIAVDAPSGPAIVIAAVAMFVVQALWPARSR